MKDATLLEVSYEVSNKVGGIYTVLVSKMSYALENFAAYYAIGPFYAGQAANGVARRSRPRSLQRCLQGSRPVESNACTAGGR